MGGIIMGSGVSFYISNEINDQPLNGKVLAFMDTVKIFLIKDFSVITDRCDLLIKVYPYEDKLFSKSEVNELIGICEVLNQKYCFPEEPWKLHEAQPIVQELSTFLKEFKSLCIEAIYLDSLVCLAGN